MSQSHKELLDLLDGIQAEQITLNGRLDDLDFQLGEVHDLLQSLVAMLEPDDAA